MFVFYVSYAQYDIFTMTRWQQRRHFICWAFYRTYIFNGHLPLKKEQVFSVTIEKESEFILAWYKLCTFDGKHEFLISCLHRDIFNHLSKTQTKCKMETFIFYGWLSVWELCIKCIACKLQSHCLKMLRKWLPSLALLYCIALCIAHTQRLCNYKVCKCQNRK